MPGDPPKKNKVPLFVGLSVGLVVLVIGGLIGWNQYDRSRNEVMFKASVQSELTAMTLFEALEYGKVGEVYDQLTTARYKTSTSRSQFEAFVKANPALVNTHEAKISKQVAPSRWFTPTQWTYTYVVTPYRTPRLRSVGRKPPGPGVQPVTCTLKLVAEGDNWMVDEFTIP